MKKLLLTDVDGTLTRKSVVLSHCGYLINEGIIKDDGSFKAWELDPKNESLIVSVAENYRHQIKGKKVSSLKPKEFINSFLSSVDNWYNTLGRLIAKREQGFDIYLITGSSDFLIKELAKALKVKYFATEYKTEQDFLTGEINGMFSESQKDDCIQWNLNPNEYEYIEGWGDTASDYGIFKHCDYNLLVEPTYDTLKALATKEKRINEII